MPLAVYPFPEQEGHVEERLGRHSCSTTIRAPLAARAQAKIDFGRDVQPIFKENCYECHGRSQQMRGLRLDRRRDALPNRIGANGARIIPGSSPGSLLYRRLTGEAGSLMPPGGPLRPEQISIIKAWIHQGAEWPTHCPATKFSPGRIRPSSRSCNPFETANTVDFKRLVKENLKAVNGKGDGGWTPLMYAALYGKAEDVRLSAGSGREYQRENDDGGTALMYAIEDTGEDSTIA